MPDPSLDFRIAMGQLPTGVTVVTTLDGSRPLGITINALASVSLDPPMLMVAIDRGRFIVPAIDAAGRYAVNILDEAQQDLSDCFAGADVTPGRDAFCGAPWHTGVTGLPILDQAIASLECTIEQVVPVGDHRLYIARVDASAVADPGAQPLLYHRRRYLRIERSTTATVTGIPESPAG